MYTSEEADFMAQLLGNCPSNQVDSSSNFGVPSSFWPNHETNNEDMEGLMNVHFILWILLILICTIFTRE
ncbi:hypothetical protein NC653_022219 [Populus alba x Populus x berolinensis]|uniref:Uncharacterized protein n=1 Tax=Populus alba x Populus x berolinensis TaxID=444605 RepID=A0AAD6Q9G1_9ROSI|nr:hypothetical protein NC653_022219 [Populus alba x Populus x berolinensis]